MWMYCTSFCIALLQVMQQLDKNCLERCTHKWRYINFFPWTQWHCWFGDRKGIWNVKNLAPAFLRGSSLEDLWGPGLTLQ